jgi:two-component system CheB/CheR fusion protein
MNYRSIPAWRLCWCSNLDPDHASALPQILTRATRMPLREVANNLRVEANHVYVIPSNSSLIIAEGVLKLQPRQAAKAVRSIDRFFESLAQDQRERAIGVVLSGTASDGTLGLEAIKANDGITFAQDDSARYESMPRSAMAAGCVDFVLSPREIAHELTRIARHPYVAGQKVRAARRPEALAGLAQEQDEAEPLAVEQFAGLKGEGEGLKQTLLLLRKSSGVDFSLYRTSTILRRVSRRVVLNKLSSIEAYAQFLRGNTKELQALYADVLIDVSSFFRNPDAFDVLKRVVFPRLFEDRRTDPIRVWVLGCSNGQEPYSVAMALTEYADRMTLGPKLQIFATDVNEVLLEKARTGLYAKAHVQDVSPQRLRRFFVEEEGGYRIQGLARRRGIRPAESAERSPLLAAGPDQLPQPDDLPRIEPAAEDHSDLPLCP